MGCAIIASTVLVKQHYVVDLFAGAVVYFAARALLDRLVLTGRDPESISNVAERLAIPANGDRSS